ncbi:uncharacterized protein L969DRAFT_54431 [Mixia osmundae IAM 14324]|uniref:Phosphoglycerate mutase n=1 Tax=Mixia osmundae (strain CBS 9802 / IAM 14324 / JCM 22182 / KY 12970) TaxID=764103 RepID=G7E1F7_MIXOS|nr:uncharacterized protein L969DRAFT_54431 [Mixia osmundae IAM 14324]KEI36621.1 hypothetical protein L969DRAFT_54431 [Mixia osmundae IAM 14324]GAA96667.1 hypothetical protein E5Q_03338 [Mixia osmundae IAM 14324]
MSTTVIWIRHGETADNAQRRIQGWIDTPLHSVGEVQAHSTAEHLKNRKVDAIYSSDLVRCRKTAEIIGQHHRHLPIQICPEIRERGLGKLEGTIYGQVPRGGHVEGAEPFDVFIARLRSFWSMLFATDRTGQTVLVISHGGPIKAIIPDLIGTSGYSAPAEIPSTPSIANCSLTTISVDQSANPPKGAVVAVSDASHLRARDVANDGDFNADTALEIVS